MKQAVSVYFVSALALACSNNAYSAYEISDEHAITPSSDVEEQVSAVATSSSPDGDSLQVLLRDMKQFRAGFAQTVVDAEQNIVHEAQGVLTMTRPNKLRWETTFPDETLLIADGNAVWNVDSFVEQVTVISQDQAIKDNPIVLLTASDAETWNKFTIRKVDTSSVEGEAAAQMLSSYQITPKEVGGQIETLTLTFNQDNKLAALNMLDAQQQISTLVFNNIETRFPLAADTFSVDIPDSYIVDDQR